MDQDTIKKNEDYNKIIISLAYGAFFGLLMQFGKLIPNEWLRVILLFFLFSLFIFIVNEIVEMLYRNKENEKLYNVLSSIKEPTIFDEKYSEYISTQYDKKAKRYEEISFFIVFWSTTICGLSAAVLFIWILLNQVFKL